ncbi:MAG TPA: hypothetical protein VNN07_09520 [Candidatus Tectomicrobia bacterium]|nr:hypothetical protein [Candidatus Tectomicrobia bacterium]
MTTSYRALRRAGTAVSIQLLTAGACEARAAEPATAPAPAPSAATTSAGGFNLGVGGVSFYPTRYDPDRNVHVTDVKGLNPFAGLQPLEACELSRRMFGPDVWTTPDGLPVVNMDGLSTTGKPLAALPGTPAAQPGAAPALAADRDVQE